MILSELIKKKLIVLALFSYRYPPFPEGTDPSIVRKKRMQRWRANIKLQYITGFDFAHPEAMSKLERRQKFIEYIKQCKEDCLKELNFSAIMGEVKVYLDGRVEFLNDNVTSILRKLVNLNEKTNPHKCLLGNNYNGKRD